MEAVIEYLSRLENTLNSIEVKGQDNLDKLLGSIRAVQSMKQILLEPPKPPQAEGEEHTEQEENHG